MNSNKKLGKNSAFNIFKVLASIIIYLFIRRLIGKGDGYKCENILFINTGQIGDLVISTLILVNEHIFPTKKKVYLLVKKQYSDFYSCYNGQAQIILWDRFKYRYSLSYRIHFLKQLRSLNLELAVNITTSRGPLNDELTLLSGAAKKLCLVNDHRYLRRLLIFIYDRSYDNILGLNGRTEYEKQAAILSYIIGKEIINEVRYFLDAETIFRMTELIGKIQRSNHNKIIVINPLSDLEAKNWPSRNYHNLISHVQGDDYLLIFLGTRKQRKKIEAMIGNFQNIVNLAGDLSIPESAALIYLADLYIGNDSGFTHIAKALNKPLIAIIGCGSYNSFFPYLKKENEFLLYHDVECKGCHWRCIHERRYCLEEITPTQVYHLVRKFLG
jgi:ADP-heptose:LPS heptosyltransferase